MTKYKLTRFTEDMLWRTNVVTTRPQAARFIRFFFETIMEELAKGNVVKVGGFGSFHPRRTKVSRPPGYRNQFAKENTKPEEYRHQVRFYPAQWLKDQIRHAGNPPGLPTRRVPDIPPFDARDLLD